MRFAKKIIPLVFGIFIMGSVVVSVKGEDTPSVKKGMLEPIEYGVDHTVDLAVGLAAFPLPMDYDRDGDMDIVVASTDTNWKGLYFFENRGVADESGDIVFEHPVKVGEGKRAKITYYDNDQFVIMSPNRIHHDFFENGLSGGKEVRFDGTIVSDQDSHWGLIDWDADGDLDLFVGNHDMREYGWDAGYDRFGQWKAGEHNGHFYVMRNEGSSKDPDYGKPEKLHYAPGKLLRSYGLANPSFSDWDGDGDLDMVSGQFNDHLAYFENVGTRSKPKYAPMRKIVDWEGVISFDSQMLWPAGVDWDNDGDMDLVVGQEDGRVMYVECLGVIHGMPHFRHPKPLKMKSKWVKIDVLATPVGVDWDGDGDQDVISGDSAGHLVFLENIGGTDKPRWEKPVYLQADDRVFRVQAGENGSIQGPGEANWGYCVPSVSDWDSDGDLDIVLNNIWGEIIWLENIGSTTSPELTYPKAVRVKWKNKPRKPAWMWWRPSKDQLVTQWRTTPFIIDLNKDGLADLVMLDAEGYLAFWERKVIDGERWLLEGARIFKSESGVIDDGNRAIRKGEPGRPLRLKPKDRVRGWSGRRKFVMVDWDLDGDLDLLINNRNTDFLRNVSDKPGEYLFRDEGKVSDRILAGHTLSPTIVDWDQNGVPDLLIGAEDGRLYFMRNPHDAD
ncbi:FG-GAP repeat domain-containing protein [Poriferisphaera sp. WC338]|uniref:FG-GAP repeat domain-containing protein n=1 Tax=Poriferisphaera sp. WC338 TaxID=3425129 RepID=UPI003D8139FC